MFRDEAGNEDEIDRALAEDLVGDVNVTALRVSGVGLHEAPRSPDISPAKTHGSSSEAMEKTAQSKEEGSSIEPAAPGEARYSITSSARTW
jgi:hypothetical protein